MQTPNEMIIRQLLLLVKQFMDSPIPGVREAAAKRHADLSLELSNEISRASREQAAAA